MDLEVGGDVLPHEGADWQVSPPNLLNFWFRPARLIFAAQKDLPLFWLPAQTPLLI